MINLGEQIDVTEKKLCHHTKYFKTGLGLYLCNFTYQDHGYIEYWSLSSPNTTIKGNTIQELVDTLYKIIDENSMHDTENHHDKAVIYTDNIMKTYGFMQKYATDLFKEYNFTLFDVFEVRDIRQFIDGVAEIKDQLNIDCEASKAIAIYVQKLIDEIFVPERYFYITPNQRLRKHIAKAYRKSKSNLVQQMCPTDYKQFEILRESYFGGLCYCPYRGLVIDDPVIEYDRTSAFIYDLLIEKKPISAPRIVDPSNWQYYIDSPSKTAKGIFEISYSLWSNKLDCIKDIEGKKITSKQNQKGIFSLSIIDVQTIQEVLQDPKNGKLDYIECKYLEEYDFGYLSKEHRDVCVEEYINKENLRNAPKYQYEGQKRITNGFYGNTSQKVPGDTYLEKRDNYKAFVKNLALAPQWGIWTTAYARQNLIRLGMKLDGWYYSDTDCVFILDTAKNRKIVEEYNQAMKDKVKDFCDRFSYDFDKLQKLGQYKIEAELVKFETENKKIYKYLTKEGKFKLTAAGFDQEGKDIGPHLFGHKLEYGTKTLPTITKETSEYIDENGRKYISEGSYYEYSRELTPEMQLEMIWAAKLNLI